MKKYENYFWTECSGVMEILYSKYNGIKIPNVYASTILNTQVFIDEKDNEEFEFVLGVETYKYKKKIMMDFNIFEK